jgi:aminomethyltransferase
MPEESSQVPVTEGVWCIADRATHRSTPHAEPTLVSDTNEIDIETPEGPLALPLDAWHLARGARMVPFAGYPMPIQYEGIMAEHLWTRESAGLFDVSHMGQLILSGEGLDAAIEALVPGDIAALAEGKQRYSLLLAEDGGILDDLMITRAPVSYTHLRAHETG